MSNIDIKELISQVNIIEVIGNFSTLVKAGSSYKTLCNVHGDTTPSLSINPRKQIYKCFVCDHGGDALDYLIWSQKLTYNQAIEYLIKLSGNDTSKYNDLLKKKKRNQIDEKLFVALKDSLPLFKYYLEINKDTNSELKNVLESRKLTKEIIEKYSIGFAPNNDTYLEMLLKKSHDKDTLINATLFSENGQRTFFKNKLMFPIFNEESEIVAYSGRKLSNIDSSPKYVNSKESRIFKKSSIIYNYQNARKYDNLIIVEGFFDVIALYKIGYDNAIALMGTSLSNEAIRKLSKHKEILILLDGDSAGINATLKLINVFIKNKMNFKVIYSNIAKDPDEILNLDDGINILKNIIEKNRLTWDEWLIYINKNNLNNNSKDSNLEKIKFLSKYTQFLDPISLKKFVDNLSKDFNVSYDEMYKMLIFDANVVKYQKDNIVANTTNVNKEFDEPINIRKILIWIWKNPSYIEQIKKVSINFGDIKYKHIFDEIENYIVHKKAISSKTNEFIETNLKQFSSDYALPKTFDEVLELIERLKSDNLKLKQNYLNEAMKNATDNQKISYLKSKQKILSKKIE